MRRRRRPAIDTHDVAALRGVSRRTRLVRLVLAAAAVAALAATVVSVRSFDVHRRTIVPAGSSGVIIVDVSLSIANSYGDVRRSLRNVMSGDSPVGLVVFSDVAYELLPPGNARERARAGAERADPAGAWRPADPVDAELPRRDAHLRRARARRPDARARARRERLDRADQRPADRARRRRQPGADDRRAEEPRCRRPRRADRRAERRPAPLPPAPRRGRVLRADALDRQRTAPAAERRQRGAPDRAC